MSDEQVDVDPELVDPGLGDPELGDPELGDPLVGDDEGNRVIGGKTRAVVEHLASFLVDDEEALDVTVDERANGEIQVSIAAGPGDVGRIIGRRGRVIQSIRQVARAAASTEGVRAQVEIIED